MSHSSTDLRFAADLVTALKRSGLSAWMDDADVHYGALLRNALQLAIRNCRVLVLVWSAAAAKSRWVMAEMFTALYSDRFIVPCVIGRAPLPQFLQNASWLDRRRDKAELPRKLCLAIRNAPRHRNDVAPFVASANQHVDAAITLLAMEQAAEMHTLSHDRTKAAALHAAVDARLKDLGKAFPFEPMILSAAGYHRKNAYLAKHWDAIQAGQAPKDPLLLEAERFFFKVLCFKPFDPSSVNGLGSLLILERELDAAEFFVRNAIQLAGGRYPEAEADLQLILYLKSLQAPSAGVLSG